MSRRLSSANCRVILLTRPPWVSISHWRARGDNSERISTSTRIGRWAWPHDHHFCMQPQTVIVCAQIVLGSSKPWFTTCRQKSKWRLVQETRVQKRATCVRALHCFCVHWWRKWPGWICTQSSVSNVFFRCHSFVAYGVPPTGRRDSRGRLVLDWFSACIPVPNEQPQCTCLGSCGQKSRRAFHLADPRAW